MKIIVGQQNKAGAAMNCIHQCVPKLKNSFQISAQKIAKLVWPARDCFDVTICLVQSRNITDNVVHRRYHGQKKKKKKLAFFERISGYQRFVQDVPHHIIAIWPCSYVMILDGCNSVCIFRLLR